VQILGRCGQVSWIFSKSRNIERLRVIRMTDKGAYADAIVPGSSSNKTCPVGRKRKDQIAVAIFDSGISQCTDNEGWLEL